MSRPPEHLEHLAWRRSHACASGTCVEVARVAGGYLLRDAKNPDAMPLAFTEDEWAAFAEGVKRGDFE
jgi:hypothetical protein